MTKYASQTFRVKSLEATQKLSSKLGSRLKGGELIVLASDLGGGKTSLVKGLVSGAGSKDLVSSPSFTICNQYTTPELTIYHFDFYRLNDAGIIAKQLEEVNHDAEAVVVIEWPNIVISNLPEDRLTIELSVSGENSRVIKISYPDSLSYLVKGL